ncbi:MAG: vWA domain-containing protein [Promethearchaeota archaeon]|jgi:hypothetical protein
MANIKAAPGSLQETAQQSGVPMENMFMSVEHIILLDVSSSMDTKDAGEDVENKSRYDSAVEQLENLQKTLPGKIALICYSDRPKFCPGGYPSKDGGGTQLKKALELVKPLAGTGVTLFVITDGADWEPGICLDIVKNNFQDTKINAIYIGIDDPNINRLKFCQDLSGITGGKAVKTKEIGKFEEDFIKMLNPGNSENNS